MEATEKLTSHLSDGLIPSSPFKNVHGQSRILQAGSGTWVPLSPDAGFSD